MPAPLITDGKKLELRFGDVRVPIWCTRSFVTYDECSPSRQWFVSPGVALGSEEVGNIKREIAETLLFQKLLRPTSFLLIPQDLADPPLAPGIPDQDQIPEAIRFLGEIKDSYPGLIVLINPLQWYFDPVTRPAKIDQFLLQANQNGILAIDPLPRMPQASAEERSRWYNLPLDGHWSDAGAEIYGRVVAQIIRERLLRAHPRNSASDG
jgi:hypothetical protein